MNLLDRYYKLQYVSREEWEKKQREKRYKELEQESLRPFRQAQADAADTDQKIKTSKSKWGKLKSGISSIYDSPFVKTPATLMGVDSIVGTGRAIASGASPSDFRRELVDRPFGNIKNLTEAALSGEKALNLAPGSPGTMVRDQIERVPVVGRPLGIAADTLGSPLSIATLGSGGALAGGISRALGGGTAGKAAAGFMTPALRGNLARRAVGESAAALGATYAPEIVQKTPGFEKLPRPVQQGASIGSSFIGAGLGISGASRGLNMAGVREGFEKPTIIRMQTHEMADALGLEPKVVSELKKLDADHRAGVLDKKSEDYRKDMWRKLDTEYKAKNSGRASVWVLPSGAREKLYGRETTTGARESAGVHDLESYVGAQNAEHLRTLERIATSLPNDNPTAMKARAKQFSMLGIKTLDEQNKVNPHLLGVISGKFDSPDDITDPAVREIMGLEPKADAEDSLFFGDNYTEGKTIKELSDDELLQNLSSANTSWDMLRNISREEPSPAVGTEIKRREKQAIALTEEANARGLDTTEANHLSPSQEAAYPTFETWEEEDLIRELDRVRGMISRGNADNEILKQEIGLKRALAQNQGIGGGASGKLVQPQVPDPKLTLREKTSGIFNTILHAIDRQGIKPSPITTPIMREYMRQHGALVNQGSFLETNSDFLVKLMKSDKDGLVTIPKPTRLNPEATIQVSIQDIARKYSYYKKFLSPEQQDGLQDIRKRLQDFVDTLDDYGVDRKKVPGLFKRNITDPEGFWLPHGSSLDKRKTRVYQTMGSGRTAGRMQYPNFSSAMREFTSDVANLSAEKWLATELKGLKGVVKPTEQGMQRINLRGAGNLQLPKEHAQVVNQALRQAKGLDQAGMGKLIDVINKSGRAVWASTDLSWIGVNGLIVGTEDPRNFAKAFEISFRSLGDPVVAAKFIKQLDAKNKARGMPVLEDWIRNGLHFSGASGRGTDIDLSQGLLEKVGRVPGIKETTRAYTNTGDIMRYIAASNYYDLVQSDKGLLKHVGLGFGKNAGKANMNLEEIAKASNRATGYSSEGLGDVANSLLFAPRFLSSQIELIQKSFSKGSDVDKQLARRQLAKLIGFGVLLTGAANLANDEFDLTEMFDPTDPNFMRIKNVMGQDISVFGPWDSLVKGIARSKDEPTYLFRSKASPVVSIAWDMIGGEDFVGNKTRTPLGFLREMAPFSMRDVGNESPLETATGAFGIKSSALSKTEILNQKLEDAGITRDDPDYLILRRDYLESHPEDVIKADRGEAKFIREVKEEVGERELENERATTNDEQTLVDYRKNRTTLVDERRNRLKEVVKNIKGDANTEQEKWVKSYYEIFSNPDVIDPKSGKPDPEAMDAAEIQWIAQNGEEAFDFIQRYTLSGKSGVEKQYLTDLQTLAKAGYFETPRYRNLKSNLSDDELDDLRTKVSSARSADPKLAAIDFSRAARIVLKKDQQSDDVIRDVVNIGSRAYQDPEYAKLKIQFGKELMWFNPNALYSDYDNFQGKLDKSSNTRSGLGSIKSTYKARR